MTVIQASQKDELVKRAVEHRKADRLLQGFGFWERVSREAAATLNRPGNNGERTDWEYGDWAGCAIGCLATPVMSQAEYRASWELGEIDYLDLDRSLSTLEEEFGVPRELTRMAERLFEALPKDDAMAWPEQFARALPVGVPLDEGKLHEYRAGEPIWVSFIEAASDMYDRDNVAEKAIAARDDLLAWLNGDRSEIAA